jgi:hypothetical protein
MDRAVLGLNEDAVSENGITRPEAIEQLEALERWEVQTAEAVRLIAQLG